MKDLFSNCTNKLILSVFVIIMRSSSYYVPP